MTQMLPFLWLMISRGPKSFLICIEFLRDQFIISIFYTISSVHPRGGHRWKWNQFWKRSFMTMKSRGVQGLCNNRLSLTVSESPLSLWWREELWEWNIFSINATRWINPGRVCALVSFTLVQFCPRFTQFFSRFSSYFFLRLPSYLPDIVFPIEKANIFLEWKLFLINRKWILMIIHS